MQICVPDSIKQMEWNSLCILRIDLYLLIIVSFVCFPFRKQALIPSSNVEYPDCTWLCKINNYIKVFFLFSRKSNELLIFLHIKA